MRDRLVLAPLFVGALLLTPVTARAAVIAEYAPTGSEDVVAGVSHEWGTSQTDTATQKINVLSIDHSAPNIEFDLGLPFGLVNGRQRTTNQALASSGPGHQVVAAVNGDFWQKQKMPIKVAAPAGLNVRAGELISGNTSGERGALGFSSTGGARVGTPTLAVSVTLPGDMTVSASGVNRVRLADQLVLFTPRFGPSTATDASGVEVVLTGATLPLTAHGTFNATVAQIRPGAGNTAIAAGQLVLSATGVATAGLSGLAVGDPVTITTTIDDAWQDVVTAVGGTLLFTPDETPDFSDPKWQVANPRTAAGVTADGDVLLVTVDGRSETSGGMIISDLIDVLRSMGAVEAINLDGGGSTTMAVDPAGSAPLAVANDPSQSYERQVNTTLQVVSTAVDPVAHVSQPVAHIVPNVSSGKTDAAVQLSWTSTTSGNVVSTRLQRLGSDGQWHDIALQDPDATQATLRFKFGKENQFRVRITDDLGSTSDWATSPSYILKRFNEGNQDIVRSGKWTFPYRSTAIGGHVGHSAYDGKTHVLSMDVNGVEFAVVAQEGPNAGTVQVTVGSTSELIDIGADTTKPRMVVFVGTGQSVSVANAGSHAHPSVDIDAFLVLTTN